MAELRSDFATLLKSFFLLIALLTAPVPAFAQSAGAGTSHTSIVTSGGGVWSWGNNGWGQLGDNSTAQRVLPVNASPLATATAVADGDSHTLAITSDGNVWASR